MKFNLSLVRQHYGKLLLVIIIIILLIICFSHYKTKEMYREHITDQLNTDIQSVLSSIQDNNMGCT